jgi:hypothetical protein
MRLRRCASRASRRGAGRGRDRRSEEGHPNGRSATPVLRHRRKDRELPARGPPVVRLTAWAHPGRRRLYLRKSWTDDPARRAEAGAPDAVTFATKPQLARRLIDARSTVGRHTGDEAYGGGPAPGRSTTRSPAWPCACRRLFAPGADRLGVQRADRIAAGLPNQAWQRISAGDGAKGHHYYDWAFITLPLAADQHAGLHLVADPPQPNHR